MKRKAYEQAFPIACELLDAEELLERVTTDEESVLLELTAQRFRNQIFPAASQAAASRRSEIKKAALQKFRENGGPFNVTEFISELRKRGLSTRLYRGANSSVVIGDSSIRKIVAQTLGMRGRSGRTSKG